MDFVYHLRIHPTTKGDFTGKDSSFREYQTKVVGDYSVTYWMDEPVKAVMFVNLRPADE